MKHWIESSKKEIELSSEVAPTILSFAKTDEEIAQVMMEMAIWFLDGKKTAQSSSLMRIFQEHNELLKLDIKSPFPHTEEDLSTNFFSSLAFNLRTLKYNLPQKGIVATPSYLAYEMTKLAVSTWIQENSSLKALDILKEFDSAQENNFFTMNIIKLIEKITFYDSSVGGGVYPLSILTLYTSLGIPLTTVQLKKIYCCDLDPLFIEVTKIRIILYYKTHGGNEEWKETREILNKQLFCKNSLLFNSEQALLDSESLVPKVDIVLGNPPYVKADKIQFEDKRLLKEIYPSVFSGKADLYIYFIANAINSLKNNGILCFISPATFQKSLYGKDIRKYLQTRSKTRALFDFDELPVFQNINSHLSVYSIAKSNAERVVLSKVFKDLIDTDKSLFSLSSENTPKENISESGWYVSINDIGKFIHNISKNKKPLREYLRTKIYSGIKTGHQKTYLINEDVADSIMRDRRTEKYVKSFLYPVNIKRWKSEWMKTYMIVITSADKIPDDSDLMKHLLKNKHILEKRSDLKGKIWYQLRDCSYYDLLNKPKIVFPDISKENRFMMDKSGYFINDGAFFIPQEDYYLLGLLNSSLALRYFKIKCSSVGNSDTNGRLRFKKTYIEDFPIPERNSKNESLIKRIEFESNKLTHEGGNENMLNDLVKDLYQVNFNYE